MRRRQQYNIQYSTVFRTVYATVSAVKRLTTNFCCLFR